MPAFKPSNTEGFSDKSELTRGRHPAFLCAITEDLVPEDWAMFKKPGDTMFRWHFAIWGAEQFIASRPPEHQTAVSSRIFSPAGKKNPASKCWLWTAELIGRFPNPGEAIDLDPLMPLPCRLKVERTKRDGTPVDFAIIADLEGWPEGAPLLTPDITVKLRALSTAWSQAPAAAPIPEPHAGRFAQPARPTTPAMAAYGNQQGVVTPPPTTPTW